MGRGNRTAAKQPKAEPEPVKTTQPEPVKAAEAAPDPAPWELVQRSP